MLPNQPKDPENLLLTLNGWTGLMPLCPTGDWHLYSGNLGIYPKPVELTFAVVTQCRLGLFGPNKMLWSSTLDKNSKTVKLVTSNQRLRSQRCREADCLPGLQMQ